jgi:hypothetical protein
MAFSDAGKANLFFRPLWDRVAADRNGDSDPVTTPKIVGYTISVPFGKTSIRNGFESKKGLKSLEYHSGKKYSLQ